MGLKRFIVAILRWFNSEPRATTGGTYVRDAVEQDRARATLRSPTPSPTYPVTTASTIAAQEFG
ncbi:MAG: hypothetical protein R3B97_00880 [Dehalococcoidia bacterium]